MAAVLSPTEVSLPKGAGMVTAGGASRDNIDETEELLIGDLDAPWASATLAPAGPLRSTASFDGIGALDGYPAPTESMVFTAVSSLVSGSLSQFLVFHSGSAPGDADCMLRSPSTSMDALRRVVAPPGTPRLSGHRSTSLSLPTAGTNPSLPTMLESSAVGAMDRTSGLLPTGRSSALDPLPKTSVLSSSNVGVARTSLANVCGDVQASTIANAMTAALARGVAAPGGERQRRSSRPAPVAEAPCKRPRLAKPTLQVDGDGVDDAAVSGRVGLGGDAPPPATEASVDVATALPPPPTAAATQSPAIVMPLRPTVPTEAATTPTEVLSAAGPPSPPILGSTATSGSDEIGLGEVTADATNDPDKSSSWASADRLVPPASLAARLAAKAVARAGHDTGSSATGSRSAAAAAAVGGTAVAASALPKASESPFILALDESSRLTVTLSRPLSWNERRSEWNWCKSWYLPDVTARLIMVRDGSMLADGASPNCPLIAYLTVAVSDASEDRELNTVGMIASDGSITDVQRVELDAGGVAQFSRFRLAATSAAFRGRRFRLVVRVERSGGFRSDRVVLAAGGDGGLRGEAADLEPGPRGSTVVATAMSVPFRVYSFRQTTAIRCRGVKSSGGEGDSCVREVRRGSVPESPAGDGSCVGDGVTRAASTSTHAPLPCEGSVQPPGPTLAASEHAPVSPSDDGSDSGGPFPVGGGRVPCSSPEAIPASVVAASAADAAPTMGSVLPLTTWGAPAQVASMPAGTSAGGAISRSSGSLPPFVFGSSYLCTLPPLVAMAVTDDAASTADAPPGDSKASPSSTFVGTAPVVGLTLRPPPVTPAADSAAAVPVVARVPPTASAGGGHFVPFAGLPLDDTTVVSASSALSRARLFVQDALRVDEVNRAAAATALPPPPAMDVAAAAAAAFTSEVTLLHDRTRAQLAALQSATCATVSGGVAKGGVNGEVVVTAPCGSFDAGNVESIWPATMPESVRTCFSSLKNELALYAALSSLLFKELAARQPRVCESYEMDLASHVALVEVAEGGCGRSGDGGGGSSGKSRLSASMLVDSGSCAAGASMDLAAANGGGDHGSDSGGYDAAASFLASHRLATVVGSHLDKVAVHLLPLFKVHFAPTELAVLARRLSAARCRGAQLLATK
ncbi:hypothetical protein MMPV_005948 [Pyropia vietnamensis]